MTQLEVAMEWEILNYWICGSFLESVQKICSFSPSITKSLKKAPSIGENGQNTIENS
jgi:hypothetical protein